MQYNVILTGKSGLIQHAGTGIDSETEVAREIAKLASKKASIRTVTENGRIRDLETIKSLWLDDNKPTVPPAAIRACIEAAARKSKEGPSVREGLLVTATAFHYDEDRYGADLEQIAKTTQFTVPVVVQRSRILRTRALFETPWSVACEIDTDPDLVDAEKLTAWLELAGRRIGLGDWRPQKSGTYGRFTVESVEAA